jgi:hypothetical protein
MPPPPRSRNSQSRNSASRPGTSQTLPAPESLLNSSSTSHLHSGNFTNNLAGRFYENGGMADYR